MKMSMNVDTKKVKGTAIPKNNQAKKNLKVARETLSQVVNNIPADFTYAQQFKEIPNAIQPILDEIKRLNGFIEGKAGVVDVANSMNYGSSYMSNVAQTQVGNVPLYLMNNQDYQYYINTQSNITMNMANVLQYLDKSSEEQYASTMSEHNNKKLDSFINFIKKGVKFFSTLGQMDVYAAETQNNENEFDVTDNVDLYDKINDLGGDSIQGITDDGSNIFLSIVKKKEKVDSNGNIVYDSDGKPVKENSGGIIAKYDEETDELKEYIDLWKTIGAKRAGHVESPAYNTDARALLVKNCIAEESSVFEIDDETKNVTEYKIPRQFRAFTYDKRNQQLIGFRKDDKTITYMKRNETKKEYSEQKIVNLDYDKEFENIQGISCDARNIYIYQSGHEDVLPQSEWKIYIFDYDGKKLSEHKIGKGFIYWPEVEGGYIDGNNTLHICGPFEVAKVNNYTPALGNSIRAKTSSNNKKSKKTNSKKEVENIVNKNNK